MVVLAEPANCQRGLFNTQPVIATGPVPENTSKQFSNMQF